MKPFLRFLFIVLALAVLVEGYYILSLMGKADRQSEELKDISMQIQSLKNERQGLEEELSAIKKLAGEGTDGHTGERKN